MNQVLTEMFYLEDVRTEAAFTAEQIQNFLLFFQDCRGVYTTQKPESQDLTPDYFEGCLMVPALIDRRIMELSQEGKEPNMELLMVWTTIKSMTQTGTELIWLLYRVPSNRLTLLGPEHD